MQAGFFYQISTLNLFWKRWRLVAEEIYTLGIIKEYSYISLMYIV